MGHSIQPRKRNYVKGYGFLLFARNFGDKVGKKLIDIATMTGIATEKVASKKTVHKTFDYLILI